MTIDEILDELDEMLDRAWRFPLSGGRCVLDAERVRDMIDDIRLNIPQEIKQAKAIVADRAEIISTAKQEAENIVKRSEERAKVLLSEQEIVKMAQIRANELVTQSQQMSREMKQAATDFAENMMKKCEDGLIGSLNEIKQARSSLRNKN